MRALHSRERLIIGSLSLVAVMLAVTPWSPRYGDELAPFVSSSLLALVLLVAASLAFGRRVRAAASIALAAGAWAMLSPILLGFLDQAAALWTHILAGGIAVLLSAGEVDLDMPDVQGVPVGTVIGGEPEGTSGE